MVITVIGEPNMYEGGSFFYVDAIYAMCSFFMENDKANERAGHLMVSDYHRPRPRATPQELQVRRRPTRWVGRRSPALPDAKLKKT